MQNRFFSLVFGVLLCASMQAGVQGDFNPYDPSIRTIQQWWDETQYLWGVEGMQYTVKGIVHEVIGDLGEDGTLTFRITDDGNNDWENDQPYVLATFIRGLDNKPFKSKEDVKAGDMLYVFGYCEIQTVDAGYYLYENVPVLSNGYVAFMGTPQEIPTESSGKAMQAKLPRAESMYDLNGNGLKQFMGAGGYSEYINADQRKVNIWLNAFGDIMEEFASQGDLANLTVTLEPYSDIKDMTPAFLEDFNKDGKVDVSTYGYGSFLSSGNTYTWNNNLFGVTNMDINRDGRPDFLVIDQYRQVSSRYGTNYGQIAYQQPDGSFVYERMNVMTWDEYVAQMTDLERDQMANPQNYSLGDVSKYEYALTLGGASLARAPKKRAPGINPQISAPTKAIDLNRDGLIDLVDEQSGTIYTNMGDGKWVWTATNGLVIPADLNNDGILDFIFPGAQLYVGIYDKTGKKLQISTLYKNAAVDDQVYCYDFDRDGDIDILVTFTAANNATGYAYTCFFTNDGKGKFFQQAEQDYGDYPLTFKALQDLDGDGYYDLLALNGTQLMWLKGNNDLTFADPELLVGYVQNGTVNVEDLDNDGKMEVWVSDVYEETTKVYSLETTPNTRPTAPSAPTLTYKDGFLTITWGNGSDNETAVSDLTYALRIGTDAGGNDILAAHANKDGSRRNFLDGNMGKLHSYTIDLRSYSPSTVYVAVQAIDAQHMGSAWSAESIVKHNNLSADFTLSSDKIAFGETVKVYYTSLPDGYKHQWEYADGELLRDGSYLHLTFPTPGEKTITHTVIAPDAQTASASKTLVVLPAGLGNVIVEDINNESYRSASAALTQPLADFNYDGRLDGVSIGDYSGGNYYSATVQTGNKDKLFQKAAGLWNTNILADGERFGPTDEFRWLDWNRDGHVDLLVMLEYRSKFAQLLHLPNGVALTAREDNDTLQMLFGTSWKENKELHEYYTLKDEDFLHSGRPTIFYQHPMYEHYVINFAEDGSLTEQQLKATSQQELFGQMLENHAAVFVADFDHDGWTDLASLYSNTDTWSGLVVFYNRGNGRFEYALIPFVSPLQLNTDKCHLADFNGDGFQDLIVSLNIENAGSYILWNNANNAFSAPEALPNSQNITDAIRLTDIDNNGHLDLMALALNPAEGEGWQGVYVWYMGEEGLLSHGFLQPKLVGFYAKDFYLAPDEHVLLLGNTLYSLAAQSDERPEAPTNIRASLTDEGLLIEWDAAKDDHTPAALMRYNLSVRRDGAETYLISPQNGGFDKAMYLPGHKYINATRFVIPLSELTSDTYEIRLQALDRQNKLSVFSETLLKEVVREPIEAPTFACAGAYVTVSFRGDASVGTPVWDFDGAHIQSGSGFGPYSVYWDFGGEKTIRLSLNGQEYTRTITIDDPSNIEVYLPSVIYEGTPVTVTLPDDVRYAWYASVNGSEPYIVTANGIQLPSTSVFVSYDRRLTANGLSLSAHSYSDEGSLSTEELIIYLKVTNENGCETWFMRQVTVLQPKSIPTILTITTEENGHNRIQWTSDDAIIFSSINIYKEGSALNDFRLIGAAPAADCSFTDNASDATQKAERYRITGVTSDGSESPFSDIHKTVHLTISKGVVNGTFNLIWNEYVGTPVSSYHILRGESPNYLRLIETLASSNTSFTDQAPVDEQPYYAIEYYLDAPGYYAPSIHHTEPIPPVYGRSNVVNRKDLDEGIENVSAINGGFRKFIRDGVLYIERGEKVYTLTGIEIK